MKGTGLHRVAVLYSGLSGYMAACLRTLKEAHGINLLVFRWPRAKDAPFDENTFSWIDSLYTKDGRDVKDMTAIVERFEPQVLFMAGWLDSDYLHVARRFKRRGVPVVAGSDTQWSGSLRQQVGRLVAPWYLHSAIDVLWVAGERQRQLAEKLGYTGPWCWKGLYACDWERFAHAAAEQSASAKAAFLYVGRYVEEKGVDVLLQAYRLYRTEVRAPWPLICAGAGPLKARLKNKEGVVDYGFVQPDRLPGLMREAGAFILPSRKEPWGVVVQEAAASGLPLLCSTACGAAVHFLQDRYNGFEVETGNAEHLAQCMALISKMPERERVDMGRRSYELSRQLTPRLWARTFVQGIEALDG